MSSFRNSPRDLATMPPGVPFIICNEAAERFSFYGMRAILVVFMTQHLLDSSGAQAPMKEVEARATFHLFAMSVYFFPLMGAFLADALWGKYRTIFWLSLVYCLGHLVLAANETRMGLAIGLTLIALGSGGIKPCVSAHVGDQFGARNQHLLSRVFMAFYWAINLGAVASKMITPWLLVHYGAGCAFGVPGVLMALATWVFWLGRHRFIHVPAGGKEFLRQVASLGSAGLVFRLGVLYLFVAVFWSLFDQTGSAWVLQAGNMDTSLLGWEVLPSQVQSANPLLILLFIPLFTYGLYPLLSRWFELTALRKVLIGFFLMVPSFVIPAYVESRIVLGEQPSIVWHLAGYILITAAEVMISITCLEYSYSQAPKKMKSVVMGLFFLSISLGNAFTWLVNIVIENSDGSSKWTGPSYYWFFTAVMLATALAFIPTSRWLRRKESAFSMNPRGVTP